MRPKDKTDKDERTMCIRQGVWPPLKPIIESYLTTFSLDCFVRSITHVCIFHIELTLKVAMVTENDRQYRQNRENVILDHNLEVLQAVFIEIRCQHS